MCSALGNEGWRILKNKIYKAPVTTTGIHYSYSIFGLYRIWARSYNKYKGDYEKLSNVRNILRKLRQKLLEIT